jgi:2-oxoglutarate ferredoxin oxidoreductase subunit alpha
MQAIYGRHGEAPLPVLAARSPADCFDAAIEAVRIAVTYRTPVILLSDGYLANGAEPWRLPDVATLPRSSPTSPPARTTSTTTAPRRSSPTSGTRDAGTPVGRARHARLMHRVGGIEKADGTGNISYDPRNHEKMVHLRADKIAGIARDYPATEVEGDDDAGVLVLGWGSTWGSIGAAVKQLRADGHKLARCHLTHLFPLPDDLGDVLRRFERVLVPEMNLGQLSRLVRAEYLVDATPISKVQGLPFTGGEIEALSSTPCAP